jgi:hypothetical protein
MYVPIVGAISEPAVMSDTRALPSGAEHTTSREAPPARSVTRVPAMPCQCDLDQVDADLQRSVPPPPR